MKPLSEWSELEIKNELFRYRARQAWLRVDFAERIKSLEEGIEPLENELIHRRHLASESSQSADSHINES